LLVEHIQDEDTTTEEEEGEGEGEEDGSSRDVHDEGDEEDTQETLEETASYPSNEIRSDSSTRTESKGKSSHLYSSRLFIAI
jgi:hypothetical protein